MIILKYVYDKTNLAKAIPAYIENGKLVIGQNGCSNDDILLDDPDKYNAKDFEYFSNHKRLGIKSSFPCFLYKGKVPYKLIQSNKYSALMPFIGDAYFCKCTECGNNFIIDSDKISYYNKKNLVMPTKRCKSCIKNKKEQYKHCV